MSDTGKTVVVAGAGGFIGGHLVAHLRRHSNRIRAVDIKALGEWHQVFPNVENVVADLTVKDNCCRALDGASEVFNLAANMGGMGFIENN